MQSATGESEISLDGSSSGCSRKQACTMNPVSHTPRKVKYAIGNGRIRDFLGWILFRLLTKTGLHNESGGPGQSFSVDSLLPRLAHKLRLGPYDEADTLQITHRLDKETTGALVISRYVIHLLLITIYFLELWRVYQPRMQPERIRKLTLAQVDEVGLV
ncbi:unnamed protein product [Dibothriocephalus latus]|uniref:Pseudouridine synthase RsuA/RluA-like domain-containing protein n=1 Tax=Dibothriocephalus latus TaxID=60516 RepID=A0A3P7LHC7_DIBLA|nr:unnamed protein product [Dibothriocephalus latus]